MTIEPAGSTKRLGQDAVEEKGWWKAHRWLIARRISQLSVLAMFLLGPWVGVWIIKGNLASSLVLDQVPLTEPLLLLQMVATGLAPAKEAWIGAAIVLLFYSVVGGRAYCSWVCPINPVSDAAHWLRERLGIRGGARFPRQLRHWMLAVVLLLAAITGTMAYEFFNPVTMLQRGLLYGLGLVWVLVISIFLFDLLVAKRGWCSHLCPMGALYGLVGRVSLLRVRADQRDACNDCMDCFDVCPEAQVIKQALKGADKGVGPVIVAGECTNCGRCIDVCSKEVFVYGWRVNNMEKARFNKRVQQR